MIEGLRRIRARHPDRDGAQRIAIILSIAQFERDKGQRRPRRDSAENQRDHGAVIYCAAALAGSARWTLIALDPIDGAQAMPSNDSSTIAAAGPVATSTTFWIDTASMPSSVDRWLRDPTLAFPRPRFVRGKRIWRIEELDAFDQGLLEQS